MRRKDRQPPPEPLAASTAERLAAIVEAAERAAVTVIDDAEEQARRRLEQAEIEAERLVAARLGSLADLTDSLFVQAEEVRVQAERLAASLREATRSLEAGGGPERVDSGRPEASPRGPHLTAVDSFDDPAPRQPTDPHYGSADAAAELHTPAGARLLATQMAVSGSSREEIEARLRNGFEIEDTASILDAILGPEE